MKVLELTLDPLAVVNLRVPLFLELVTHCLVSLRPSRQGCSTHGLFRKFPHSSLCCFAFLFHCSSILSCVNFLQILLSLTFKQMFCQ